MSMIQFEASLEQLLQKEGIRRDLPVPLLVERALERHEGILTDSGAFRATTGHYTGRSPEDRFIVDEPSIRCDIDWGKVNRSISSDVFSRLYDKVITFLNSRDELFLRHGYAGADPQYRLPVRIITELAWHNLFARQLFLRPDAGTVDHVQPAFTVISAPSFRADPSVDGTHSEAFIIISFERKTILIGGTEYAGEMKKAIFSVMNFLLPKENVLSMHCSANVGREGDTALFFGLSGTGKTTLSADPERMLIGDDEHAWSHNGIFNLEGGCYAKTIHLTEKKEPDIYRAIRFGSVLENVYLDRNTRKPDYDRSDYTENTRAAYPIDNISHCEPTGMAGHPETILFLTADASGVLPPISKLTPSQAMYHFLSGYTSKLAGTERGITEPQPTFSTCFGAPFLPLEANVYAEMLGSKMLEHGTDIYLINTGWTGGAHGTGERMPLKYTRAMVRAALNGDFNNTPFKKDTVFGLAIPEHCPGVPDDLLEPRNTWKDKKDYDRSAKKLADAFKENFKRFTAMPSHIKEGGPY